jgi:hypothetical protein
MFAVQRVLIYLFFIFFILTAPPKLMKEEGVFDSRDSGVRQAMRWSAVADRMMRRTYV